MLYEKPAFYREVAAKAGQNPGNVSSNVSSNVSRIAMAVAFNNTLADCLDLLGNLKIPNIKSIISDVSNAAGIVAYCSAHAGDGTDKRTCICFICTNPVKQTAIEKHQNYYVRTRSILAKAADLKSEALDKAITIEAVHRKAAFDAEWLVFTMMITTVRAAINEKAIAKAKAMEDAINARSRIVAERATARAAVAETNYE